MQNDNILSISYLNDMSEEMMNYEYYKIFYYVGKHKNITRAATELFSSQPAVTRVIQNMEHEFGCRLFSRTKSGVEFTREGELLFNYVSVAYQQLVRAEEELDQSASVEGGTLYIGATVTALSCYLMDFLNAYRQRYPNVKFKIQTSSTAQAIESLKNGVVDMAFVTTPCAIVKPMVLTEVMQFDDIVIGGKSYSHLSKTQLGFRNLTDYPFICLAKGMQQREFIDGIFAEHDMMIAPDIESDGADLMISMVANGWGLAIAPEPMTREGIARGEIFQVPFDDEIPARKVCLVTNPLHPQTRASRQLCRMVIEQTKKINS